MTPTHGADRDDPRVRAAALVVVRAAVLTLPAGGVRDRYRSEHLAELHALREDQQFRYAAGALVASWALRRALLEGWEMTTTPNTFTRPLLCRLNLHHRWTWQYNPAGEVYRRCRRCGKDHMGDRPSAGHERPLPFF